MLPYALDGLAALVQDTLKQVARARHTDISMNPLDAFRLALVRRPGMVRQENVRCGIKESLSRPGPLMPAALLASCFM